MKAHLANTYKHDNQHGGFIFIYLFYFYLHMLIQDLWKITNIKK